MCKYLYIVIDRNKEDKHLSYHRTQGSAYYEVARLSNIPFTRRNFNKIGSSGGWESEQGNYFVLEKELNENKFIFEEQSVVGLNKQRSQSKTCENTMKRQNITVIDNTHFD